MDEIIYKEVYYNDYCKNCEYQTKSEKDDPCYECLDEPVNVYSHKPVNYKEKTTK